MTTRNVSQTTTEPAPVPVRHILTATPVPVVILPPAHALMPVSVPEPLATDLRALHARVMAERAQPTVSGRCVPALDFDQWLLAELEVIAHGHSEDAGAVADRLGL